VTLRGEGSVGSTLLRFNTHVPNLVTTRKKVVARMQHCSRKPAHRASRTIPFLKRTSEARSGNVVSQASRRTESIHKVGCQHLLDLASDFHTLSAVPFQEFRRIRKSGNGILASGAKWSTPSNREKLTKMKVVVASQGLIYAICFLLRSGNEAEHSVRALASSQFDLCRGGRCQGCWRLLH